MVNSSAIAAPVKVEFPQASPSCTLKQRVGLTDIEVDYSRPGIKGRDIFGGLVPYDKVWRTGANSATKIVFSAPVKLEGVDVPAGTYALMTIPNESEWTVILNKVPDQWGAYKYDEKNDLARFKVTPKKIDHSIETFTIEFNDIRDDSSIINIVWDKVVVPVHLKVDYVNKLVSQIETEMASDDPKKPYFQAALFYLNNGQDLEKAKKWIDAAVTERDAHFIVYVKAKILAKLGDKAGALAASKHSLELAEKANDYGYIKLNKDLITSLQ